MSLPDLMRGMDSSDEDCPEEENEDYIFHNPLALVTDPASAIAVTLMPDVVEFERYNQSCFCSRVTCRKRKDIIHSGTYCL